MSQDITIGSTSGGDWEDFGAFFAQRGSGDFAFGQTEPDALRNLMLKSGQCGMCGYPMKSDDRYGCPNCLGEGLR